VDYAGVYKVVKVPDAPAMDGMGVPVGTVSVGSLLSDRAMLFQLPGLVNIQKAIENDHRNSGFSH